MDITKIEDEPYKPKVGDYVRVTSTNTPSSAGIQQWVGRIRTLEENEIRLNTGAYFRDLSKLTIVKTVKFLG